MIACRFSKACTHITPLSKVLWRMQKESAGRAALPLAVVPVSALSGAGVAALASALQQLLRHAEAEQYEQQAAAQGNFGLDW